MEYPCLFLSLPLDADTWDAWDSRTIPPGATLRPSIWEERGGRYKEIIIVSVHPQRRLNHAVSRHLIPGALSF